MPMSDQPKPVSSALNARSAERLLRAARAARSLSETLWEALHEELLDPHAPHVHELSERLADVSATVALLTRAGIGPSCAPESPAAAAGEPAPVSGERSLVGESVPAREERPSAGERMPVSGERPLAGEPVPAREERPAAVLVDEWPQRSLSAPASPAREQHGIQIRDERREQARGVQEPAHWIASIERRLERYERDRAPFAVLLLELAGIERLRHSELPGEVARLTGLAESVLADELRPADSLTRESPGRYWLLAPEADASSARVLAERLAEAVRGAASHRGAPLQLAVGIALCPADGSWAGALAAHADVALYAARAAGRPLAP